MGGSPLAGLAVHDQLPARGRDQRPQRVETRGHHGTAEVERLVGAELRRRVGAGPPHLAVGHEDAADDGAAALGRPAVLADEVLEAVGKRCSTDGRVERHRVLQVERLRAEDGGRSRRHEKRRGDGT